MGGCFNVVRHGECAISGLWVGWASRGRGATRTKAAECVRSGRGVGVVRCVVWDGCGECAIWEDGPNGSDRENLLLWEDVEDEAYLSDISDGSNGSHGPDTGNVLFLENMADMPNGAYGTSRSVMSDGMNASDRLDGGFYFWEISQMCRMWCM